MTETALCPDCGEPMTRDLFGAAICLPCIDSKSLYQEVILHPVCPICGNEETDTIAYTCTTAGLLFNVYCVWCSPRTMLWERRTAGDAQQWLKTQGGWETGPFHEWQWWNEDRSHHRFPDVESWEVL